MIDDVRAAGIVRCRQSRFGDRHTHRITDALAEWAGGGFDAWSVAVFGMAWRLRTPLAELFEVVEAQVVAGKIEH